MSEPNSSLPLILSCEHATAQVPTEFESLFHSAKSVIRSHRGWDPGAIEAAVQFQAKFACPLLQGSMNRLVVELNRSLDSSALWSEFSDRLPASTKAALLKGIYHPYRQTVEEAARKVQSDQGTVIHLSVHSLTPELNGQCRDFDIALLFDPQRPMEVELCEIWSHHMQAIDASLRIAFNTPYKGTDDGLVESFRRQFDEKAYIGIEIEYNQSLLRNLNRWREVVQTSVEGLARATKTEPHP